MSDTLKIQRIKRFKCIFIKNEPIKTLGKQPMQLIEQEIITDQEGITVVTPPGYTLFQITEYLPDINQCKQNEKAIN
jgi:hypothetical protein